MKGAVTNPQDKRLKANKVKVVEPKPETVEFTSTSQEVITSIEPVNSALSKALESKQPASDYFTKHTIQIVIQDRLKPVVQMDGFWDGMLLKAAMHAIERKYDEVRKISAINAMRAVQQKAQLVA